MPKTNETIVRTLIESGITRGFTLPGLGITWSLPAFYDAKAEFDVVLTRNEWIASVMTQVTGRLTGRPAVLMGQGPWVTTIGGMGILEAHFSGSPMVVLTETSDYDGYGQMGVYQTMTGDYGGADAMASLKPITKYSTYATTPEEAVYGTQMAVKHALLPRQGPAAVVMKTSIIRAEMPETTKPKLYGSKGYYAYTPSRPDSAAVAQLAEMIDKAERPVIIAGNGVRISQAYDALAALAHQFGAPVATTASGKGVIAETHDWALGTCGNFGQATANAYIGAADLVLAVGTRLGPADTTNENPALIDPARQTLIQIDIEPKNASWTYPCDTVVIGDAALVLRQITEAVDAAGAPSADAVAARKAALDATREEHGFFADPLYDSDAVPIMPPRLFKELHRVMADDALVTCDAGENRLFMTHFFQTKGPGSLLMPGIGAMGYAVPAALAGKLVFPDRQVIAVTGDGGFSMAMNGIMTARDENIPIVVVVLNNSALGWVKHGQGNRTINSSFSDMNFADIAKAIGVNGIRVEQPAAIAGAIEEALAARKPTVVDVVTAFDGLSFRDVTAALAQS